MLFLALGALLIVAGLVVLAGPPIWRGRLSGRRSRAATVADNTLEPREPAAGFTLAASWPGLALIALGAILLLVGAAF
jgi:hypothetical protein